MLNLIKVYLLWLFLLGWVFAESATENTIKENVAKENPVKLRFYTNWFAEAGHGGFYAAVQDNTYAQHDLAIELIQGGPRINGLALLASNRAEMIMLSAGEVVSARAEGIPLVAIFSTYQTSPMGLMFHTENPLSDFSDLAGRTVTITPGATYWAYIEKTFNLQDKVKVLNYNGQIAEWLTDKERITQSYITTEPFFAKRAGANPKTFLVADAGFRPYNDIIVITESLLAEETEAVAAFIKASRIGWQNFLISPLKYAESMKADNEAITTEMLLWSNEQQLPLILNQDAMIDGIGSMKMARWEKFINQLESLNLVKEGVVSANNILPLQF